jgi:hypothetical protein
MRPYRRFKQHGPAAEVQSAIWLIGLGILFLTGWWWPGILIVIGVSMVAGALVRGIELPAPAAPPEPPTFPSAPTMAAPAPPPPPVSPAVTLRPEPEARPASKPVRLPDICPNCGAPPRSLTSRSEKPGVCPFCGSEIGE